MQNQNNQEFPSFFSPFSITIELVIDAENLFNDSDSSFVDPKVYCVIKDPVHQATGNAITNFNSEVFKNLDVKWIASTGLSVPPNYLVAIEQIEMKNVQGNTNVFDSIILPGYGNMVKAEVTVGGNTQYKYNILFSIQYQGYKKYFLIDPELRGSTRQ